MNVILIPGFWLTGESWAPVVPALEAAGHTVLAPTLPGKRRGDTEVSGIGLRSHIDAVAAIVDSIEGPVALVGHSGGGAIAHGVADARPGRLDRIVYVDAGPLANGNVINDEFEPDGDAIPLPAWEAFGDAELTDMSETIREQFRRVAGPEPLGVATEPQQLSSPERFGVPVTLISCTMSAALIEQLIVERHPYVAELAQIEQRRILELPTGHWPQLTKPVELSQLLVEALSDHSW